MPRTPNRSRPEAVRVAGPVRDRRPNLDHLLGLQSIGLALITVQKVVRLFTTTQTVNTLNVHVDRRSHNIYCNHNASFHVSTKRVLNLQKFDYRSSHFEIK